MRRLHNSTYLASAIFTDLTPAQEIRAAQNDHTIAENRLERAAEKYAQEIAERLDDMPDLEELENNPGIAKAVAHEISEVSHDQVRELKRLRRVIEDGAASYNDRDRALKVIDRRIKFYGG